MSRAPRRGKPRALVKAPPTRAPHTHFDEVVRLIEAARARALVAVNTALIDLYWRIGEYLSQRVAADGWGKGTVLALAEYIQARHPAPADTRPRTSGG